MLIDQFRVFLLQENPEFLPSRYIKYNNIVFSTTWPISFSRMTTEMQNGVINKSYKLLNAPPFVAKIFANI